MKQTPLLLALTGTFFSSTAHSASPLPAWQVTVFNTHSPAERPGSDYSFFIRATISNPGSSSAPSTPASTANCTVEWTYPAQPYGTGYACTTEEADAAWTLELENPPGANYSSPTENVDARFTLVVRGAEEATTLSGTQHFEVGENLEGVCGGSGTVSVSPPFGPVLVPRRYLSK